MTEPDAAARRWREVLAAWAVPERILAAAPRSPFGFSVSTFARIADDAVGRATPTTRAAAEALPAGGIVLDVGCGAGAASLPLAGQADRLVGVDEDPAMLEAFAERAARLGVGTATVAGRWPDVAGQVPAADVVVSRNVVYNVPDLDAFAVALTASARRRVVVELTAHHPMTWTAPFWQALHGLERPRRPTVHDAVAVLEELELDVTATHWGVPWLLAHEEPDAIVDFLLRRLCLGRDRAGEVRALLAEHPVPTTLPAATLWWPGAAADA